MLINLRNALMAGKRLPYDAEVEYLESTGTQWIDTGVDKGLSTTVGTRFMTPTQNQNSRFLFGIVERIESIVYRFAVQVNGQHHILYPYSGTGISTKIGFTDNIWHDVELDSLGHFVYDGTTYSVAGAANFSTENRLYLFARNNIIMGDTDGILDDCRIAYFKVYDGTTLVRDFIPVRKGTVGYLYDRVSGKLFGNEGTGDFVVGPDVVPVEYIENVASSYINAQFKADNACKFEIDFENKKTGDSYNPWLFGSRNGSSSAVDKSCVFLGYTNGTSYAMMGSAMPTFNQGLVVSGRHTLTMSLSEGVGIDGVVVATYTPSEQAQIYTNTHPNVLFSMWNGSSLSNYFIGRVYSFKVLKNGVPQIDFRPVRVGTDATSWAGAMMDVLTRRIYRNAGTGAFTYGNDLKYPIPAE